ncbi:MAG: family N-acetyltransferase [Gemmatimonadetes bacterium]|nr:family N-acetyltransferase [Gemmatimonadota bacterium]
MSPPDADPRGGYEVRRGDHVVSDDPARLDPDAVHRLLLGTFWGEGMDADLLRRAMRGSHSFGLYRGEALVGYARVITDYARNAHLADVVVSDGERGKGLGKWLVECVLDHPALRDVRTWQLATTDAHELYRRFGFTETPPGQVMRRSLDHSPWMGVRASVEPPSADPASSASTSTGPPAEEMGGESACQMHRFYDLEES